MSDELIHTAPTLFLLMAQYNGQTVVPLDRVCRDFFGHLTVEKLLRKALRGDIALPIVRIETKSESPAWRSFDRSRRLYRQAASRRDQRVPATCRYDLSTTAVQLRSNESRKVYEKASELSRFVPSSSVNRPALFLMSPCVSFRLHCGFGPAASIVSDVLAFRIKNKNVVREKAHEEI